MGAHLHHAGLEPGIAQTIPRWTIQDINAPASAVAVESRTDSRVIDALRARGHRISVQDPWVPGWGPVSVIAVSTSGLRDAVADPRVETALALSR